MSIKKLSILIGLFLGSFAVAGAVSIFNVQQGGTGAGTFTAGNLLYGNGTNPLSSVATTTASCSGSTSCSSFTVIGSSPVTISSTGGTGGSGNVATSTAETAGQLPYWTTTSGTPAKLGSVATSSITYSAPLTTSGTAGFIVGGSGFTLGLDTSGTWSGNAGTATALATNGTNCSAGYFPLGVNASGASENCTYAVATSTPWTLNQLAFLNSAGALTTVASSSLALPNTALLNSSVTVNGTAISLGASGTITAASSTLLADSSHFTGSNTFTSTITGSISGNAGTATALQNARTINGVSFDGTANITVNAASSTLLADSSHFTGNNTFSGGSGVATTTFNQGVQITATGNVSNSTSAGGIVNITNTLNAGAGLVAFTNHASGATGRLAVFRCGSLTFDQNCVDIEGQGTQSVLNISGAVPGLGVIKAAAISGGVSTNDSSILSLDASVNSFQGQGLFIKGNSATTTALIHIVDASSNNAFSVDGNRLTTVINASSTQLSVSGSFYSAVSGLLKGNGISSAVTAAANGTDYTLLTAQTCSAGSFISALTASGGSTCTAASGSTALIATSSAETAGQLPFWTSTNGTPAKLGSVATTTLTANNGLTLSAGAGALVGGSNATIGLATLAANSLLGNPTGSSAVPTAVATSTLSIGGNAATATQLLTARTINGVSFDGTANIVVASTTLLSDSNNWSALQIFGHASTTQLSASGPIFIANGSLSAPSIALTGNNATGFYGNNATLAITAGGTQVVQFTTSSIQSNGVQITGGSGTGTFDLQTLAGTVTSPNYSFVGDTNTGIYRPAADNIAFAINGGEVSRFMANGAFGVASTSTAYGFAVGGNFAISSTTGEVIAKDVTNNWLGRVSPTHSFVLSTGTTTTWTASTTSTGYSPFLAMPFAGTLQQVRCVTDSSFLGVNVQVNGSDATPNYFVGSTTVGTVKFTAGNTFTAGQKVLVNFGTTTTAGTKEISCTFDSTETP